MSQPNSFGRRAVRTAPPPAPSPLRAAKPDALDPRAEAFAAEIAAARTSGPSGFDAWRRSQRHRTWTSWALTLLSFAPGVVTVALDAPLELSIGLEIAALVGNVWIRPERFRRGREIVAWEDPADDAL